MNVFIQFAPKFLQWPLAIARELRRRDPEMRFSGLATGQRSVFERVAAALDLEVAPLHRLDDLERLWLATPCDETRLADYEARLGADTLRRIVTSDRQLGAGLVSGARAPETPLSRAMGDPEMVRRYVVGVLDYVFETLGETRPDLVFCYTVAGSLSFALTTACRQLGIPFAQLTPARLDALYVVDDSVDSMLAPVRRRFEEALRNPRVLEHSLPVARKHLEQFRATLGQPDYVAFNRRLQVRRQSPAVIIRGGIGALRRTARQAFGREVQDLRVSSPFARVSHAALVALRARRLTRQGPFRSVGEIPERRFAYFPLHVDPEASTMVLAPMHTDQLAAVEALVKSLPLSMDLVVKEHSPMLGLRPRGFYQRLARMPGVVLASPFENSLELMKRSAFTAVITGTAAWEALRLKRPVLIIGASPYCAIGQGFVHCPDLSDLPSAVSQALSSVPATDERLELYLAALLDLSFEFPTELFWGNVTAETVRRNPRIATAIADRLLEIVRLTQTQGSDPLHHAERDRTRAG